MTTPLKILACAGALSIALFWPRGTLIAGPSAGVPVIGGFVSPGKPGAQVALTAAVRSPGDSKAAAGQRLDIELALALPEDVQALSLAVAPGDVLTVVNGADARFTRPKGVLRHVVSVVPQAEGRHYLSVSVSLRRHGETRMRSFAVPVRVGSQDGVTRAAAKGVVTRNSEGEAIVITLSR